MIRVFIIILFLFLNGCTTFKKEVVKCPKLISPKKASEIVVNSENNLPVYLGFRGVKALCFKEDNSIKVELSVNIRAIRKNVTSDDYAPVNISVVSVDSNNLEFDRDGMNYSQFLLKGSKIIERVTTFNVRVPVGGEVFIGIK